MKILVCGVHGVGKSTLCSSFAKNNFNWDFWTASDLIKKESGSVEWGINKRVERHENNQNILAHAIKKLNLSERNLLLDGHLALRDTRGNLVFVSKDLIREIDINAVILIEDDAEAVQQRQASRGGHIEPIDELVSLVKAERDQAKHICESLAIPLKHLFRPDFEIFSMTVDNIFFELSSKRIFS